jgi:hypothetical protein
MHCEASHPLIEEFIGVLATSDGHPQGVSTVGLIRTRKREVAVHEQITRCVRKHHRCHVIHYSTYSDDIHTIELMASAFNEGDWILLELVTPPSSTLVAYLQYLSGDRKVRNALDMPPPPPSDARVVILASDSALCDAHSSSLSSRINPSLAL